MDFDFGHSFGLPFAKSPFARLIPTFAGSQYGTLDTPIALVSGDTVEVEFATTTSGASMFLFSHSASASSVEFDAGNLLQLIGGTVTIDGTAVADGASVTSYQDGKIHTLIFTATGSGTVGYIGQNGAGVNFFIGQILSIKFTDQSGSPDVITNYVFDSGSITEQFARGSSTLKATLINFATTDWSRYTQQRNITHDAGVIGEAWIGDNIVVNGTFDADLSGWTVTLGGQTVEWLAGQLHIVTDGSSCGVQQEVLVSGHKYFTKIDYVATSARLKAQHGSTFYNLDTTKTYKTITQADGEIFYIFRSPAVPAEGYIDNISVQHLLEVA